MLQRLKSENRKSLVVKISDFLNFRLHAHVEKRNPNETEIAQAKQVVFSLCFSRICLNTVGENVKT